MTAGNLHVQSVHTRRPEQQVPLDARRFLPLQKAAAACGTLCPASLRQTSNSKARSTPSMSTAG
jgi:hypothetical protein